MKRKLFASPLCCLLFALPFFYANISNAEVFVMADSGSKCLKGNGRIQTKVFDVLPFKGIVVNGAFQVNIHPDSKSTDISISSDGNLIPFIDISSKLELLTIQASRSICSESPIKITIRTPTLNTLFSDGVNDVFVFNLQNSSFDLKLTGSGSLQVSGKTTRFKAVVGGSAELQAKDLHAEYIDIVSSGSSEAAVSGVKRLKAQSTGASQIVYYGVPDRLMVDEREAGEVRAVNSGIIK